jgi:hypothetical protein
MGIDSIIGFARSILAFLSTWGLWAAFAVLFINLALFVKSVLTELISAIGGAMFHTPLTAFTNTIFSTVGLVIPSNLTTVLAFVVALQLIKVGLIIFISVKRLYFDMLFTLNKTLNK